MRWLFVLALFGGLGGCSEHRAPKTLVSRAELGIFFGGQVQKRDEIPFSLDRAKQTQGFRIDFAEPLARPARVHWEIDRPNPKGRGRAVELGEAEARPGAQRFDREIAFEPGDPLGTWNVRVLLDDELVIDRPVSIYDATARKRAVKEAESAGKPGPRREKN